MIAKIVGRRSTYETRVLRKFDFEERIHAVHMGHNKLMRMLVISDYETGFPRKVYGISVDDDDDEIDEEFIDKYVDDFKHMPTGKKNVPPSLEKIND